MTIDDESIEDKANSPKRVTGDEGTVEERPVQELIDADRYNKGTGSPPYGMRQSKIRYPGTP